MKSGSCSDIKALPPKPRAIPTALPSPSPPPPLLPPPPPPPGTSPLPCSQRSATNKPDCSRSATAFGRLSMSSTESNSSVSVSGVMSMVSIANSSPATPSVVCHWHPSAYGRSFIWARGTHHRRNSSWLTCAMFSKILRLSQSHRPSDCSSIAAEPGSRNSELVTPAPWNPTRASALAIHATCSPTVYGSVMSITLTRDSSGCGGDCCLRVISDCSSPEKERAARPL
mmetsp:Transcript_8364/g.21138  ORF Transcript_8364/g.21138 Transcript_8364/m.21138 type:complete len:227 (-) Transcript_8364:131-811(-)